MQSWFSPVEYYDFMLKSVRVVIVNMCCMSCILVQSRQYLLIICPECRIVEGNDQSKSCKRVCESIETIVEIFESLASRLNRSVCTSNYGMLGYISLTYVVLNFYRKSKL